MTDDHPDLDEGQPGDEADSAWDAGLQAVYGSEADIEGDDDARSILETLESRLGAASRVLLPDEGSMGDSPSMFTREGSADERRIGRYTILGEIARGGMGVILRGRDVDLGRDVAMKVLKKKHANRRSMVQRFVEEAQIGGQLQHPGIVPVYEIGLDASMRPYFAMKLINGRTFSALLGERRSATDDRGRHLQVFEQICQTIAYAHSRNVIHRDVKPANVMVGTFGEAQVFDWGFAKVLTRGGIEDERQAMVKEELESAPDVATVRSDSPGSHSLAGSVLGTPSYMPPEQALGNVGALDERADVFSLGAILCEILTGNPPYVRQAGSNVMEQAQQASLDQAYERLEVCGADQELIDMARDCLAAERDARPRDAGIVARRVSDYLAQQEERTREAQVAAAEARVRAAEERKARRLTAALAASLVILVCGGVGFAWWRQTEQTKDDNAIRASVEVMQAAAQSGAWTEGEAALRRARSIIDSGRGSDKVRARLDHEADTFLGRLSVARARQKDERFIDQLRAIHTRPVEGARAEEHEYAKAFQDFGIDVLELEPEESAKLIRGKGPVMAEGMAFALDDWAARLRAAGVRRKWRHLVETAAVADPHPWRKQLRDAILDYDEERLLQIAADLKVEERDPRSICLLAIALRFGERETALGILRDAFHAYPQDFWINFYIGFNLSSRMRGGWESRGRKVEPERLDEALTHTKIALSQQPKTASIRNQLAILLQMKGEPDEALIHMNEAVALDPDSRYLRWGLATLLVEQGNLAWARREMAIAMGEPEESFKVRSALARFREAYEIRSGVPLPQIVEQLRASLDAERRQPELQHQLGIALYRSSDWAGAANAAEAALTENQADLDARWLLARSLLRQGRFQEAVDVAEEGRRQGDDNPAVTPFLEKARARGEMASRLDTVVHGEQMPTGAEAAELAQVLLASGRFGRAAAMFTRADPDGPRPSLERRRRGRGRSPFGPRRGSSNDPPRVRDAVSAMARAGCEMGADRNELDDASRTRLREQALRWFSQDLNAIERNLERSRWAFTVLEGWLYETRLECVREDDALNRLPPAEAAAWRTAWARASDLLGRTRR